MGRVSEEEKRILQCSQKKESADDGDEAKQQPEQDISISDKNTSDKSSKDESSIRVYWKRSFHRLWSRLAL